MFTLSVLSVDEESYKENQDEHGDENRCQIYHKVQAPALTEADELKLKAFKAFFVAFRTN